MRNNAMIRNGEISLSDAKRVLRKYWWIPALSTLLFGALGFVATLVLPKKYTSSTSVLVEQPVVPADYVKPVVTLDLNQRLASMKAQLLSSSRLQPVIDKFTLFPDKRAKVPMEVLVWDLQKSVDVELLQPMPGAIDRQPPGFRVAVTFDNPHVAQQICQEITSMFMEQNATRRMAQATETTEFMSEHLEQAKAKMDEQDARLAQFKRQYLGSLPEEEQANLQLLTGLNTQLEAATQALNRAEQDKAFNETMLSQGEANWKLMQSGQQNPDTQEKQLEILQDQLTVLLTRYTPEYPDVMKLKTQIEDLKKRMSEEPEVGATVSPSRTKTHEPPQLQQLRAKIKQDEINIADLTRRQTQIQDQIHVIQGRVQSSPMVEERFKELTRNYQAATDFYNELMHKRANSAMAADLEHQQQSETFRVLDPPSYPSSPSFPKLPIFVGGGFGAGLVLALGVLYALAMVDRAIYTEGDVEKGLKLPVLVTVPILNAPAFSKIKTGGHGQSSNFKATGVALKV
jgi:polysaccharide chain length determinant protein (PEP-CTERM system associated)